MSKKAKIPLTWENPSGQWHLGKKYFHQLAQVYKDDENLQMDLNQEWAKMVAKNNKDRKIAEKPLIKDMKDEVYNDIVHIATDWLRGHVMHVSGLPIENFDINLFKEFLNKYAPIGYIVYKEGGTEANIRFHSTEKNVAFKVIKKMNKKIVFENIKDSDGKIHFQGQEIHCKVLEGEEEEKFWAEILEGDEEENYRRNFIIKNLLAKEFQHFQPNNYESILKTLNASFFLYYI
uniref:XRRM domain-containing protein n=1 Tax=Panagrolaimus superbus TaxID=310955 RepID=A0A914YPL6_9BILA